MQRFKVVADTYFFDHEDGLLEQRPLRENHELSDLDDADYAIQFEKDELAEIYGEEIFPNPDPELQEKILELLERIEEMDKPNSTEYVGTDRLVHFYLAF